MAEGGMDPQHMEHQNLMEQPAHVLVEQLGQMLPPLPAAPAPQAAPVQPVQEVPAHMIGIQAQQAAEIEMMKFKAAMAQDLRTAISQVEVYGGDLGELTHFLKDGDRLWEAIAEKERRQWLVASDVITLRAALIGRIKRRVLNQIQCDAGMDWTTVKDRLKRSFGGGRWAPEEDMLRLFRETRDARQSIGSYAATLVVGHNRLLDKLGERQGDPEAAAMAIVMTKLLKVQLAQETGKTVDPNKDFLEVAQGLVDDGERERERTGWQGTGGVWTRRDDRGEDEPGRSGRWGRRKPREGRRPREREERSRPNRDQRKPERRPSGSCYECGKPGHIAAHCPRVKCFECGNTGHMARHCPYMHRRPRDLGEPMEVNFHRVNRKEKGAAEVTPERDSDDTSSESEIEDRGMVREAQRVPERALRSYAAVLRSSHARQQRR